MNCPASVKASEGLSNGTSDNAEEGTAAHTVGAAALIRGSPAAAFIGQTTSNGWKVTAEMAEAVQVYLDYVRRETLPDDDRDVEAQLKYSDELWGTADYWRYRPSNGNLLVVDYKHGKGVFVGAKGNPQGLIYGLMKAKALGNRGVSSITFAIVQPRCESDEGPVREYTVDAADMLEFEDKLLDAIAATKKDDAEYMPGDHCRWCPAAGVCPALRDQALASAKNDFVPGLKYDPAELAATLEAIPLVEAWVKATWEFAYNEVSAGKAIPGFKLVQKRATRKWANEATAAEALSLLLADDDLYKPRTLRTPADVEKQLGKKNAKALAGLVVVESSGTTLVHESDRRPAVAARATAAEDFGAA
jgi:hypothetical protein